MWSFLSKGLSKELAKYDIGDIKYPSDEICLWNIHKAKNKATSEELSAFIYDIKAHNETETIQAKNAFKRIKTLRHPGLLTYLDGVETDSHIYIITPSIEKLSVSVYKKNSDEDLLMSDNQSFSSFSSNDWGIFKLANILQFLNIDCAIVHNNICVPSIYCDKAGEWKLFGLEYAYSFGDRKSLTASHFRKPKGLSIYDSPEQKSSNQESWSVDVWSFACLIWELFNGQLKQKSQLKITNKLPKSLISLYCEMMNSNPCARLSPAKFLERCLTKKPSGYLNTPCLAAVQFLDEIQMKDANEKKAFFTGTLPPMLDSFSPDLCKHKILPQIVQAFDYCEAGTSILPSLLKIGNSINDPQAYDKYIRPCIIKLYSWPDRVTRIALLENLHLYHDKLSTQTINDNVFGPVVQGFADTNPVIKEATIKAMVYIAPKLNYNNLNVELVKHFARLQGTDPHGGIRTNTTVCLGKIAKYFDSKVRQKILVSAFTRPFRDEFPSARKAALQAISVTNQYYTIEDIAKKILPSLCSLTVDTEKEIRDLSFQILEDFLVRIKDVSENPEKLTEYNHLAMVPSESEYYTDSGNNNPVGSQALALGKNAQNTLQTAASKLLENVRGATEISSKVGNSMMASNLPSLNWVSTLITNKFYGPPTTETNSNVSTNEHKSDSRNEKSQEKQNHKTSNQESHKNNLSAMKARNQSIDLLSQDEQQPLDNITDDFEEWEDFNQTKTNSNNTSASKNAQQFSLKPAKSDFEKRVLTSLFDEDVSYNKSTIKSTTKNYAPQANIINNKNDDNNFSDWNNTNKLSLGSDFDGWSTALLNEKTGPTTLRQANKTDTKKGAILNTSNKSLHNTNSLLDDILMEETKAMKKTTLSKPLIAEKMPSKLKTVHQNDSWENF